MPRSALVPAALFVAVAAWLCQGTIAFGVRSGERIAVLPTDVWSLAAAAAAAVVFLALVRRGASAIPVSLLALTVLPWVPVPLPPAFLVWTGPLTVPIWIAVFVLMAGSTEFSVRFPSLRPELRAGLLALGIFAGAAWAASPAVPGGDEPHYLIITQSLLKDGDLRIENNHRQADYREYFAGDLSKPDYFRRGRDGEIYSIHAPGVSALVLPAFAIAGYPGAVAFLLCVSALCAGLVWHLAHRVTGSSTAAWFGWGAVVFSPTMVLNAFTVYPDGPAGAVVLSGIWALVRARTDRASGATSAVPWLLHGAALAVLPWLHTRLALPAGAFGALILLHLGRTKNPAAKACAFLAVPAMSALGWIAYFVAIYGVPDPAIPYRGADLGSPAYIPGGFAALLFDQLYGLCAYAPVLAIAVCGIGALARRRGEFRMLTLEFAFIAIPYLLTVTHFAMWWGGFSAPARFFVPLLPMLGIPAAVAWQAASRRGTRMTMMVALGATAFISGVVVLVDDGRLGYLARTAVYAPWLDWVNRVVDLQHGLPSFFSRVRRGWPGEIFFKEIVAWIALAVGGWWAVRASDRVPALNTRAHLGTAAVMVFATVVMIALTIVWRIEGVEGSNPAAATMTLLRQAGASSGVFAADVARWRILPTGELFSRLGVRMEAAPEVPGGTGADRALFALPRVPAGEYALRVERQGKGGWLMVGIGRDQFALVSQSAEAFDAPVHLRFPVDVRAIVVRGDEDAWRQVRALHVDPVQVLSSDRKIADETASRAVRYADTVAFFLDDRSFPEPNAFWVGGARSSAVVLQPDLTKSAVSLLIRNAPVENDVAIEAGRWSERFHLSAGEERRIEVPLAPATDAAKVIFRLTSGFRPSALDAESRDDRFLGLWVKVE